MAEQGEFISTERVALARALSIPILALLFALLLIYYGLTVGNPGSGFSRGFPDPDFLGGEYLRSGLRTIAILFGLSCFPGGLIGAALGYLVAQNSKLASASLNLLRIGQWAPTFLWWVLVWALFMAPGQHPGRYFFVWTMSMPAVVLGACYRFLFTRHILRLDWQIVLSEMAKLAVHRSLFISLIVALSAWMELWVVYPGNQNVGRHYVAMAVLVFFLIIVNWTYRSGIEQSAALQKETFLAGINHGNDGSTWTVVFIVLFFLAVWQLVNLLVYFRVSPVGVFNASVFLFLAPDIWQDMRVSLLEILVGVMFSGALAFIVSAILLTISRIKRWMLSLISLFYVTPFIMLPAWFGWLLSWGTQSNTLVWQSTCVACLSFYPVMQTVWALREKPVLCRILLATEQALPYGFAAIVYGEMMNATVGLGFSVVVATATHQIEKAFAVFLITLSLLFGLSFALRSLARMLYFTQYGYEQAPLVGD